MKIVTYFSDFKSHWRVNQFYIEYLMGLQKKNKKIKRNFHNSINIVNLLTVQSDN